MSKLLSTPSIDKRVKAKKKMKKNQLEARHYPGYKTWRPIKLNDVRLDKAKEYIEDWISVIALTDNELLQDINLSISEEHRIWQTTFDKYKARAIKHNDEGFPQLTEFGNLYKRALLKAKRVIARNIMDDDSWRRQRYAWIMERKRMDWNLKSISESNVNVKAEFSLTNLLNSVDENATSIEDNREVIEWE